MRYFFDTDDGRGLVSDQQGQELSPEDARRAAIVVLPELARDALPDGNEHVFTSLVRDERGRVVFRARLTLHAEWVGDD
jgi:hypothetical protein